MKSKTKTHSDTLAADIRDVVERRSRDRAGAHWVMVGDYSAMAG